MAVMPETDTHIVEHYPAAYLHVAAVEPDGDEQSQYASVASQTFISRKFPTAVCHVMHRYEHLDDVIPLGEEIFRLVEDAMSQTGTHQDTDEEVEEERFKLILAQLLLLVEAVHHADNPAVNLPSSRWRSI